MATIVKTSSGTWKALIRKTGWPSTAKSFRTKQTPKTGRAVPKYEMVRGVYIQRAPAERMTVEAGLCDQGVSAISGHKSMHMLTRYTHLRAEDLVQKLDRIAAARAYDQTRRGTEKPIISE